MKNVTATIYNLIVVVLVFLSVLGYFFMPVINADLAFTFTPEIANLLISNSNDENLTKEEKTTIMMIQELGNERINISFPLKVEMKDFINCGASMDWTKTQEFLYARVDDIVNGFDKTKINEFENSIAKVSLKIAIKTEIDQLAESANESSETILQNLNITDEYIEQNTSFILESIRSENATVDSVSESVMTVIDDLYDKIHESKYSELQPYTPETKEEIEDGVKSIIEYIADENGNINSDEIIYRLISGLLNNENQSAQGADFSLNDSLLYSRKFIEKPNPAFSEENKEYVSAQAEIKNYLISLITPTVVSAVQSALRGGLIAIAISCLAWIWVLIKILFKLFSNNPLVKLKCPIIFGWGPCLTFSLIPTVLIKLLANPPAFLGNFLGAKILSTVETIFNSGLIISYSSSAIFAGVCALILFIFGFFYASLRRSLKKSKNS